MRIIGGKAVGGRPNGGSNQCSVIYDGSISFELFLGLAVELVGDFLNPVFLPAPGAAHADAPAGAGNLKYSLAFFAVHDFFLPLTESVVQAFPGRSRFAGWFGKG